MVRHESVMWSWKKGSRGDRRGPAAAAWPDRSRREHAWNLCVQTGRPVQRLVWHPGCSYSLCHGLPSPRAYPWVERPEDGDAVKRGLDWAGLPVIATVARLLCPGVMAPRTFTPSRRGSLSRGRPGIRDSPAQPVPNASVSHRLLTRTALRPSVHRRPHPTSHYGRDMIHTPPLTRIPPPACARTGIRPAEENS
jgi:hypothetical protein